MWCLIVSIPDLRPLSYFKNEIRTIQDNRHIDRNAARNETKCANKLEKETENKLNETSMRFNSTVKGLQKRIHRLEKGRVCNNDKKEADIW